MNKTQWTSWCSQHNCRPEDCWDIHNPTHGKIRTKTKEETEEEVKQRHANIKGAP